jgi:2-polyprenyl-3-methyl-5-hydroxy-6-metoxy-1,4-benzoquinol methylase
LDAHEHLAMVLSRYRAAAALIGGAQKVLEAGCGEGIGARILAKGRQRYYGVDTDADAVLTARQTVGRHDIAFAEHDMLDVGFLPLFDAVVSLDVAEHIPAEAESLFMQAITLALTSHGVAVIGTPSASFEHLASPQSKAGHINLYTHDRLRELMCRSFHTVQMLGMQDTSIHLGHPDARHYHLAVGIGPKGA